MSDGSIRDDALRGIEVYLGEVVDALEESIPPLNKPESVHLQILCAVLAAQHYDPLAIRSGWTPSDIRDVVRNTWQIAREFLRQHEEGIEVVIEDGPDQSCKP